MKKKINKKKTHEEFTNELKEKNSNIKVIGKYQTAKDKIKCKCLICNTFWWATPNKLLLGRGCPTCGKQKSHLNKRIKQNDFINKIKAVNPNIEPLEPYITKSTKITFKCKICGHKWHTTPSVVLNGHACPKCSHKRSGNKIRKPMEVFVKEMTNINPNIGVIGEYINDSTKIECLCKICGAVWMATPNNLLRKSGCPKCKSSKGENIIDNYLLDKEIRFIRQYRFGDCKNKRTLPFDFYLPDYNLAIEYDGELHYKSVEHFGGSKSLVLTQYRDNIKTQYCYENNIRLIRIPYWCYDDIEKILKRELEVV